MMETISISTISALSPTDLEDLCTATEDTLKQDSLSFNIGMNQTSIPSREFLESYWKGVLLVPERTLIVGRLDRVIASSIQLIDPPPNKPTRAFSGKIGRHFVAPWARGHGLAKALLNAAEDCARQHHLSVLRFSIRDGLEAATKLYESCGYKRWGTLDHYEKVDGKMLAGHYYYKEL